MKRKPHYKTIYNAKKYCCEDVSRIENYQRMIADTSQRWDIHHKGEVLPCGLFFARQLKEHGLYYNRPANELIFLPHHEHRKIHCKYPPMTKEQREKLSRAKMGKSAWWVKGKPKSEETRLKISNTMKSTGANRGNKNAEGRHWFNDGKISVMRYECPPGFKPGRLLFK